jgi:RES domain
MNAGGIAVFYGANEPNVAIAEVRPPVGSKVAVARFEIIRPLRLLDLTALAAVSERGSVFDPEFGRRLVPQTRPPSRKMRLHPLW